MRSCLLSSRRTLGSPACFPVPFLAGLLFAACAGSSTAAEGAAANQDSSVGPLVSEQLPKAVDLRPAFRDWKLSPRRQGSRPTCSAFTVAGALEYALAKHGGHTTRLSVEFLNWAANKAAGDTDDGAFFSDLWRGFAAYGIAAEENMPYQSQFNPALSPSTAALAEAKTRLDLGLRLHWIKKWNVHTGLTDDHLARIKRTLSRGWPVCGGFRWPKQEQWVGDVLQMCPSNAVRDGHSVLLVGYRDDAAQPGGGVFLFRNTARTGLDGYMPYTFAQAYMNDAVWIDYSSRTNSQASATRPAPLFRDPRGVLTTLPPGRTHRVSDNERAQRHDVNLDRTVLPPRKANELPVPEGPG